MSGHQLPAGTRKQEGSLVENICMDFHYNCQHIIRKITTMLASKLLNAQWENPDAGKFRNKKKSSCETIHFIELGSTCS